MRRRAGVALAMAAALTVVVTVGVRPTFASWVSTTSLSDSVGVASSSCTTPGVYRTTASSRFLSGSVAGVPLPSGGGLAALTADNPATGATFPSGATPQGADAATGTLGNATVASAIQAAGGVTALAAPSGSQTLYSAATSTGRSVAAAGAVTTAGAIDAAGIAGGTRAAVGSVDVSSVLGAVPGGTAAAGSLSQLGLSIGHVASTATLNECARRWGASLSSALTRATSVPALTLGTRADAVTGLVTAIGAQRAAIGSRIALVTAGASTSPAETAIGGAAGDDLVSALRSVLGLLSSLVGTATSTVTVTTDMSAVTAAATSTSSAASGLVRLDGANGDIRVDLASLAGATSPAPNTPVITSGAVSAIGTGVSTSAAALTDSVGSAMDAALAGTTIRVDVAVPLLGLGSVTARLEGSATEFAAGTESVQGPVVTLLQGVNLPIGLDLTAIASIAPALLRVSARSPVATQVIAPLTSVVGTARSSLTTALTTTQSTVVAQLAPLSSLLSITLNEQPAAAPGGPYTVTALHVRLRVAGTDALDLAVATSSVGPDRTINE